MKITDITAEHRAVARFVVAEMFRALSTGKREPMPRALSALAYATQAVPPEVVRALIDKGWLALPAAGQHVVTAIGRKHLDKALAAWNADPSRKSQTGPGVAKIHMRATARFTRVANVAQSAVPLVARFIPGRASARSPNPNQKAHDDFPRAGYAGGNGCDNHQHATRGTEDPSKRFGEIFCRARSWHVQ